mmetsp:Transcript_10174/g.33989  ORF Transcript_10174/g.33989 Transcript_10174/m.33989 type:complete len:269 (-) Transcript_10174:175-981(-)
MQRRRRGGAVAVRDRLESDPAADVNDGGARCGGAHEPLRKRREGDPLEGCSVRRLAAPDLRRLGVPQVGAHDRPLGVAGGDGEVDAVLCKARRRHAARMPTHAKDLPQAGGLGRVAAASAAHHHLEDGYLAVPHRDRAARRELRRRRDGHELRVRRDGRAQDGRLLGRLARDQRARERPEADAAVALRADRHYVLRVWRQNRGAQRRGVHRRRVELPTQLQLGRERVGEEAAAGGRRDEDVAPAGRDGACRAKVQVDVGDERRRQRSA